MKETVKKETVKYLVKYESQSVMLSTIVECEDIGKAFEVGYNQLVKMTGLKIKKEDVAIQPINKIKRAYHD